MQVKETMEGSVTAVSMGPAVSGEALAEALAMGVDRAVLISDPALKESDTLVTSRVLAAAVNRVGTYDLLFFGTRTADSDTGQVGPQTAALLDIPFLSRVKQFDAKSGTWIVQRSMDEWIETWQVELPAAMTIDPRSFAPRPLGLDGISRVFEQPAIKEFSLTDLNLKIEAVGLSASPTRVVAIKKIKRDRHCIMLEGDSHIQVAALMEHLTKAGVVG
jgi:electron transfer flavoprotein beta subunit